MLASDFAVYNLPDASGFTAALDLDSFEFAGSAAQLSANVATFTNLAPGGSVAFSASLDSASVGSFTTTYTLPSGTLPAGMPRVGCTRRGHGAPPPAPAETPERRPPGTSR